MAEDHGEKSQQPTAHRRQRTREAGHVAQSPELTSAGVLLGGLLALFLAGGALTRFLAGLLTAHLGGQAWLDRLSPETNSAAELVAQWNSVALGLAKALLPVLAIVMLSGVASALVQTGPLFLPGRLVPDFSRVDPLTNLRRMLSGRGVVRVGFGLVRIAVIVGVAAASLYARRVELVSAAALEPAQLAAFAWELCLWTSVKICLALAVLAVLDYGYQRWRHERDLQMTPRELREEMRQMQGDPAVAVRRRTARAEIAARRPVAGVRHATLVIGGPRLAIALRYDAQTQDAPILVARGAGPIAGRIRAQAVEQGITVVERPPLAAALYRNGTVGAPLPTAHWTAMAEVLAGVNRSGSEPAVS